ncbi:hypothetical protein BH09PSE5_BH09PSE5_47420 [soil metagenome]
MREIYVYYKLAEQDEARAREFVEDAQRRLARDYPGLVGRLLRRPDRGVDGLRTWMETYAMSDEAGSAGIDALIERDIEQAALPLLPLLRGARHVEAFIACV